MREMKVWNVEWIEISRKEEKKQVISNLTGKPQIVGSCGKGRSTNYLTANSGIGKIRVSIMERLKSKVYQHNVFFLSSQSLSSRERNRYMV
jgi:hypothetical protein